jgi:DNA-directed RNA polymerase subunit RPC12/RpoP
VGNVLLRVCTVQFLLHKESLEKCLDSPEVWKDLITASFSWLVCPLGVQFFVNFNFHRIVTRIVLLSVDDKFSSFTGLPTNKSWTQQLINETYSCTRCDRKYKNKYALNKHLKFECGVDRQFRCEECGRRFSMKHHLKNHLLLVHKKLACTWLTLFK